MIILSPIINSQSQFQQFIDHVNSLSTVQQKAAAVDSFMIYARSVGIPFIEDSTASFIYLGNYNSVTAAGDFNNWSATAWSLTRLSQTNFWYRSQTFEMDARLDYKFVLNGSNWILDPENPNTCSGGFGPNSELAMPSYIQPWEIQYNPNILHGTVISKSIYSTNVSVSYQLNIYLPPGYDTSSSLTYPTAYFQDGAEYISLGSAVKVIDNLIDSNKIKPLIAVFVTPNNRNEEYAFSKRNQYRLFFVNELVPYIDNNYKTITSPDNRLVLGDSFGGNISALISYNHPEVFGLCGLHSAAFWPNNYEALVMITSGPIKDIKWSSIWGTYESIYPELRSFRDFMIGNGCEIDWLERPEGHSWGLWRASLDRMLEYFFPANPSSIFADEDQVVKNFNLYQNYPNPFNPSTTISWQLPESQFVSLKIYDVLGNEIRTLINEEQQAGFHKVNFDAAALSSGMYFYSLQANNKTLTNKMILIK
ncbi:MAG: alpha/beta hydrolase-fold protein [Ignavibacteriales bacterium]|nr:alpha/beta hydrolase-fold protein [Ignavibacteriales bacterium]